MRVKACLRTLKRVKLFLLQGRRGVGCNRTCKGEVHPDLTVTYILVMPIVALENIHANQDIWKRLRFVHVCVCACTSVCVLRLKTYTVYTYICMDYGWIFVISLHLCPVLKHVQDWCINVYYMCMDGLTGGSMDGWIHFLYMHPLMCVDVFNLLSSVCYKLISSARCQKRASRCKPEGKNILCSNPDTHAIRVQLMSTLGNQARI